MRALIPSLMFCNVQHGKAEEAIEFYCSVFENSRVVSIERYGPDEGQPEGTVKVATFEIGGHPMVAFDSDGPHAFTFTPGVSLWVECASAEEIERVAGALSEGGEFMMPLDNYGFSPKYCWIADRYGVTWQLNLAK